jgi:hypothetical protein
MGNSLSDFEDLLIPFIGQVRVGGQIVVGENPVFREQRNFYPPSLARDILPAP